MLAKMVKLEIKSCPLNGAIVQRFNKPVSEGCCMRSPPSVIEASCNSQTNAHLSSTSWVEDAADCVESPCRSRVGSDALDLTPPALGAACSYYVAGWSDQHTPRATRADAPPQKSEARENESYEASRWREDGDVEDVPVKPTSKIAEDLNIKGEGEPESKKKSLIRSLSSKEEEEMLKEWKRREDQEERQDELRREQEEKKRLEAEQLQLEWAATKIQKMFRCARQRNSDKARAEQQKGNDSTEDQESVHGALATKWGLRILLRKMGAGDGSKGVKAKHSGSALSRVEKNKLLKRMIEDYWITVLDTEDADDEMKSSCRMRLLKKTLHSWCGTISKVAAATAAHIEHIAKGSSSLRAIDTSGKLQGSMSGTGWMTKSPKDAKEDSKSRMKYNEQLRRQLEENKLTTKLKDSVQAGAHLMLGWLRRLCEDDCTDLADDFSNDFSLCYALDGVTWHVSSEGISTRLFDLRSIRQVHLTEFDTSKAANANKFGKTVHALKFDLNEFEDQYRTLVFHCESNEERKKWVAEAVNFSTPAVVAYANWMSIKADPHPTVFKQRWMILKDGKLSWAKDEVDNAEDTFLMCRNLRLDESASTKTADSPANNNLAAKLAARRRWEEPQDLAVGKKRDTSQSLKQVFGAEHFLTRLQHQTSTVMENSIHTFTVRQAGRKILFFGCETQEQKDTWLLAISAACTGEYEYEESTGGGKVDGDFPSNAPKQEVNGGTELHPVEEEEEGTGLQNLPIRF